MRERENERLKVRTRQTERDRGGEWEGERRIRGEEENWRMGRVMEGGESRCAGAKTIIRL